MNILVLSRNPALYSTRSIVNAARRNNHYARVVDHMNCDLVIDNDDPVIYYQGEPLEGFNAVIPRIGSSATSHGSAVVRQLEAMGMYSTMNAAALLNARDKLSCLQILMANGLPVPRSIISQNYYVMSDMIDEVGEIPIVIKLIKGTHGLGVILAESKKNAESILETFYKSKQKVMLQEFVAEAKGADVRVFVVDDEIVGVMKRQAKPGEFRSNLHCGASSEVVEITDEEQKIARRAAKVMGLEIAGVDMLQTRNGPLILEVNASPGLEGIETTTKNDIARKIIRMVEKNAKASWR